MRSLFIAFAGACVVGAAPTPSMAAPFRSSQPPVLDLQTEEGPTDDGAATIDAFRRRYDRMHRPGIALFWNRELSDRIAQSTIQRQSVQGSKQESASESAGDGGKRSSKQETSAQTTDVSTFSPSETARRGLDDRSESRMRGAFIATLATGGIRLLDRSMMVRAAAAQASGPLDVQGNEMRALQGQAKYVLEVLLISDAQSPVGMAFSVSVKDVSNASIVFSEYVAAPASKATKGRWMAVNDGAGFERAPSEVSSI